VVQLRTELVVVVPQKCLDRAKTRLSGVLDEEARVTLTLALLRRTLEVCSRLAGVARLILCAPDDLRSLADKFSAELRCGGDDGMRRDITMCSECWHVHGRAALLIVSSDLPLLQTEDLQQVIAAWQQGAQLVLVPDRRQRGTNVMLVNDPEHFEYAFGEVVGPGSFHTHRSLAEGLGLTLAVIENPRLSLDLDLTEDLIAFVEQAPDDPLAQYCKDQADDLFRTE